MLRRLYAPEYLIKENLRLGELPSTREAYESVFGVTWAAIAETFMIAMIALVSTVMVSSVGESAVAAVGLVSQPRFIVQAMVLSVNMAITSICARRRGQGDKYGALTCLKQGLVLNVVLSAMLSGVAFIVSEPLLWLVGAQDDTFPIALEFLHILLLGLPLSNLSLTITAAQRGVGRTKASMRINTIASVSSLIFNYLLINGVWIFPQLGVRGAAIGTVIGWAIGLMVALLSITHPNGFFNILSPDGWKPERQTLSSIYKVASGSFLEQFCMRLGLLLYTIIIAGLGTVMLAAHIILQSIMTLSFAFGEGYSIAASAMVGANLGMKRPDLSMLYAKILQRISFVSSIIMCFVFIFAGRNIMTLFTRSEEILAVGTNILILMGALAIIHASQLIFMGSLRGAGDTRYVAVISFISIVFVRQILAYVLVYPVGLGLMGAWLAFYGDQLVRLTLTYLRFRSGKWSRIEL